MRSSKARYCVVQNKHALSQDLEHLLNVLDARQGGWKQEKVDLALTMLPVYSNNNTAVS